MRGIFNLLIGIFAIYNIGIHVTKYMGSARRLFGFEVNEYLYLLFWAVIGILCFKQFYDQMKARR